jgi:hypothetical protein
MKNTTSIIISKPEEGRAVDIPGIAISKPARAEPTPLICASQSHIT